MKFVNKKNPHVLRLATTTSSALVMLSPFHDVCRLDIDLLLSVVCIHRKSHSACRLLHCPERHQTIPRLSHAKSTSTKA